MGAVFGVQVAGHDTRQVHRRAARRGRAQPGCYTAGMRMDDSSRGGRVTGVLVAALMALGSAGAAAVTVHTWIDEAGVRHYADAPPAAASNTEVFEIADSGPVADAATDYYSVTNQWARVRAEREAAAEQRVRTAAARAAREPAWAPPIVIEQRGGWGVPYGGYYGTPYRGHAGRRHGGAGRDRDTTVARRRGGAFVPTPTPSWPRERGWAQRPAGARATPTWRGE